MLFDDENDSEDWQKFKNFTFFKFWGTNKERDEALNGSGGFVIVGIVIVIVIISVIMYYASTFGYNQLIWSEFFAPFFVSRNLLANLLQKYILTLTLIR